MNYQKCIILANGRPPLKNVFNYLRKQGYGVLICADGGANSARKLNIVPDIIIGDFDSITDENIKYYKSKSQIVKVAGQNDTDVEKCLKYAIKKGFKEAILTGVTGDRLDHTFCNLGIVIKYFKKIKISIVAERSLLVPYKGNINLSAIKGETISIYGFDKKTKIISSGLKYPLKNITLPFGERESTSNVAVADKVVLKIKNGIIFVIRDFDMIKKSASVSNNSPGI
jgi:thiamine pyrophosphokinase